MLKRCFSSVLAAVFVAVSVVSQGTWALAGTTGALTGTVVDAATKQPLVGAKISAASPSQIANGTTDSTGHFAFLNLAPDTYTVSVQFQGYDIAPFTGVTIVADNTRVLSITGDKHLTTIGHVTSRPASSLVKPGTTADVYSIDPTTQAKVAAAGGGGNLDSAFSALATVPGVVVLPGQAGYIGAGPSLSIRGGDYDQIGYEIDGIPVNRAFDNYPSGATSSLGQQELQVYTGAPPASSLSDGISGYINQVIKTGTLPGSNELTIADGGPAYYHKIALETSGESANGRFSYYTGVGGYNQTLRVYDQFNGESLSNSYGVPVGGCGVSSLITGGAPVPLTRAQAPGCYNSAGVPYSTTYALAGSGGLLDGVDPGAFDLDSQSLVADRDSVVNLHYYFPHKDGSRDDLQALYEVNYINTKVYSSTNDQGGPALTAIEEGTIGDSPTYTDGYQLKLPTGGVLPANYSQYLAPYYFPNAPTHSFDGLINPSAQDGSTNDQAIEKVQFTKSLGTNAFARVYGYSYYSNWLISGADSNQALDGAENGDYELDTHTRGVGFEFDDSINSQNLLIFSGNYTDSAVVRDNNTEYINGEYGGPNPAPGFITSRNVAAVLVSSANPTGGICYNSAGQRAACFLDNEATPNAVGDGGSAPAAYLSLQQLEGGVSAAPPAAKCGTGSCEYLIIGNGQYATYNQVNPKFGGLSLTDQFRPTSKLTINGGIRFDDYQYVGADTTDTAARTFYYNAYNTEECLNNTTHLVSENPTLGAPCPAGYSKANFTNPSGSVTETFPVFEPRLGATYSLTPTTVLRATYGRYAEPANSAFEQYNALQANAPGLLYGVYGFQQYGFTTPDHSIPPATSNNYDFSLEHQFPKQISIKLTPFYRSTQNQTENFYLNRVTSFVSGLNVGNQTSKGFEFELDKGNFNQNGLSAKLSFAYTNSTIKYDTLSNGSTVLSPVVDAIDTYNSYTKKGGGAPCYTTSGTAVAAGACTSADVANPYYNAPEQSTAPYLPGTTSIPYDTIPAGIGLDSIQIGAPYNASLVLNEKVNKLSFTPILQYIGGQRYGDPLATGGIDPATCTGVLAGSTTGDPRYKNGAAGGSPFDATTCGLLSGGIPDTLTGAFDGIGAYVEPAQLLLHMQLQYQATKNFTLTANLTNIVSTCVGGSNVPWKVAGACQYGLASDASLGYGAAGNVYNPGDVIQPAFKYPYGPVFNQQPFGIYVSGNFKL